MSALEYSCAKKRDSGCKTPLIDLTTIHKKRSQCQAQRLLVGISRLYFRFLVFWILANRFPNHWTAWTLIAEYLCILCC